MPLFVFDLIILALLAFFAWRGAKKGLILSLCSLAGIFVAFFCARFVSAEFYAPVSNIVEPGVYQVVLGAQPEGGTASGSDGSSHGQQPGQETAPSYTLDQLLDSIREEGLFSGLSSFLDQAQEEDAIQQGVHKTAAQALAGYLADLISRAGLFAVTFLVVLLVWFLVGHALDLAFHLPILSAVNLVGGAAVGLLKAALLAIVLVWLGQLAGWIPDQPGTPVLSLFTLRSLGQLLNQILV